MRKSLLIGIIVLNILLVVSVLVPVTNGKTSVIENFSTVRVMESEQSKVTTFAVLKTTTEFDINTNYSVLLELLKHFKLKNLSVAKEMSDLEDVDVLVLLGPKTLNDIDLGVLTQFIQEGGSLLLLLPSSVSGIADLLNLLGVNEIGKLVDNTSYYQKNTAVLLNETSFLMDHPLIKSKYGNVSKVVIPNGLGLNITIDENSLVYGIKKFEHVVATGLPTTFADSDGNLEYDVDELKGKNISVIIEYELWWGSKIVIFPSAEMFTDSILANTTKYDNLQLLINTVYWLGGMVNKISIEANKIGDIFMNINNKTDLNISIRIVNEDGVCISDANVFGIISLLKLIIANYTAIYDEIKEQYNLTLKVDILNKTAIYEIFILAYKEFYGFTWLEIGRIKYVNKEIKNDLRSLIIYAIGVGVPGVLSIIGLTITLKGYKNARDVVKEKEKKILEKLKEEKK